MNKATLKSLKPWIIKPFELIFHAETHYRESSDYSKRMSYINFDNSIEVSIYTFIHFNTRPKGLSIYKIEDLEKVKNNYFGKLEVFEEYIQSNNLPIKWNKNDIIYYHDQRNSLYHDARLFSPDSAELNEIRQIAFWVFSILFDVVDIEAILNIDIEKAELQYPQIPEGYVKPIITGIVQEQEASLFIATILGGWNENCKGDNEILRKVTGGFKKWIRTIREIKRYNDETFSLKNGHWQVNDKIDFLSKYTSLFYDSHLDLIKDVSLKVLSEIHPMFDLNPEHRFASSIYGKYSNYSLGLRRGISETLVFLSMHGKELKNCSQHKPEDTVFFTIRELFNNAGWKLWASLNDLLPIIAEADPGEFLSSVENALKQFPCPFVELFKQESESGIMSPNYLTGLYWALEILAWSQEHLSRTIIVLAELAEHDSGGKLANQAVNCICKILLPWFPQTIGPVSKRIASLKSVQRKFPNIAWRTLIRILPHKHQNSMGSQKPLFRKYIPEDWKGEVSTVEYWEQVREYAAMAVEMAKGNSNYILELIGNLENIPQPSFDVFLEYISSEEIVGMPDVKRVKIWEKIISLVKKHRYFSSAKWALPAETIYLLEQTAGKITPSTPEFLYRDMFSIRGSDYVDKDEDLKTHQEKVRKQRIEALKEIYKINKIGSIVKFAENVDTPAFVGEIFAYIANEDNDFELLPSFLSHQEQGKKQFISGYIWTRYRNEGTGWFENLHIITWSNEQKCNFFLCLPFEKEIWEKAKELLNEHIDAYWKSITTYPFPAQGDLLLAIENLLKYDRPRFAFACIHAHYFYTKELYKKHAVKALIDGVSSDEPIEEMNQNDILEIIEILQNDPDIDEKDLLKIEWAYLSLFDSYNNTAPKVLEKYLSQKPDFFIEIFQLAYPSKYDNKSEEETDKQTRNLADNAWKLLDEWKRPPGKMDDGSFSGEALRKWANEVKVKIIESDYFEIAMEHLGHVLFYADPDPSGLWIQQQVAGMLDEEDNDHIRHGYKLEAYNSRGAHIVDPSGKDEKALADLWRKKAEDVENLGLIRFAILLKELAHSYDREAERVKSRYSLEQESENNKEENNDN